MEVPRDMGPQNQALASIGQELSELRAQGEEEIVVITNLRRSALEIAAELHQPGDSSSARGSIVGGQQQSLFRSLSTPAPLDQTGTESARRRPLTTEQAPERVGTAQAASPTLPPPYTGDYPERQGTVSESTLAGRSHMLRVRPWRLPTVAASYHTMGSDSGSDFGDSVVGAYQPSESSPLPRIGDSWEQHVSNPGVVSGYGAEQEEDSLLCLSLERQQILFDWGHLHDIRSSCDSNEEQRTEQQHDFRVSQHGTSGTGRESGIRAVTVQEREHSETHAAGALSHSPMWHSHCNFCGNFMVGGEALRAHHVGSNVAGVFDIPSYGCADCDLMFCSSRALSQHVALSGHVSGDDASLVRYHEGEEHLSSPFSEDLGHSYSWLTSLQEELEAHAGDYSDTDFDYMMYGSDYDSEGEQMGTGCSQETLDLLLERRARTCDLDDACPICLDDIRREDALLQLPCGHVYHPKCILSWLSHSTQCPVCKRDCEELLRGHACREHETTRVLGNPHRSTDAAVIPRHLLPRAEPVSSSVFQRNTSTGISVEAASVSYDLPQPEPHWTSHAAASAMSAAANSLDVATQHLHSAEAACAAMEGIISSPSMPPLSTLSPHSAPLVSLGLPPLGIRSSCPSFSSARRPSEPSDGSQIDSTDFLTGLPSAQRGSPLSLARPGTPRPTQQLVSVFVSSNTLIPHTEPASPASSVGELCDTFDADPITHEHGSHMSTRTAEPPARQAGHHARSVSESAIHFWWRPQSSVASRIHNETLSESVESEELGEGQAALSALNKLRLKALRDSDGDGEEEQGGANWTLPAGISGASSSSRRHCEVERGSAAGRVSSHPHITAMLRHSLEMLKHGKPITSSRVPGL